MSLIPWRKPTQSLSRGGGSPMSLLQQEMNNFFDQVFGQTLGVEGFLGGAGNFPAISVSDKDDKILVTAEVPGIDADDLNVRVDNDVLTISGVKREETREDTENLHRVERIFGSFMRRIPLPSSVDADKVKAALNAGILRLELPKIAGESGKQIKIKASS